MYDNVFIGENANKQSKRILILGESHYEENGKIDGTASVVQSLAINGKDTEKGTNFYKNIMKTFGYEITSEQRKLFWNKVFCGNYVDDLCGKGKNNTAAQKISCKDEKTKIKNRVKYNYTLFKFKNENEIDVVFCFSRLVYNNLPGSAKGENEEKLFKHNTQYLNRYTYQPDCNHKHCNVTLNKKLTVYGLKHPSSAYSYEIYYEQLKKEKIEL